MPPKTKFSDNEKVLCYHGPLLYEAKAIKSRKDPKSSNGEYQYYVHYQGWNKNWDEWVGESRILKINADNLALKTKLMSRQQVNTKEKKKAAKTAVKSGNITPSAGSSSGVANLGLAGMPAGQTGSGSGGRKPSESASTSRASTPVSERSVKSSLTGKRRELEDDERSTSSREEDDLADCQSPDKPGNKITLPSCNKKSGLEVTGEPDDQHENSGRFKITLPEELKCVLANDCELVAKKHLFNVPAKMSVQSIISDFVRSLDKAKVAMSEEVMEGVKLYFDRKLGAELLYRFERPQFQSAIKAHPGRRPCELYGSAHLLRLLIKMGGYLSETSIHRSSEVKLLDGNICNLVSFLEENSSKYFTSKNYVEADDMYLKSAL